MEQEEDLIKPEKKPPVYTLAELLAQCDFSALPPEDIEVWINMEPMGQETW